MGKIDQMSSKLALVDQTKKCPSFISRNLGLLQILSVLEWIRYQSSRKRLIRRIFTPTFHVVRLKNPSGDSSVRLFFSISTCIIIVDFSLCSDQRRRLGVEISYCQHIKKITEALRLSAWCLSENGRRDVHVASACRNSQSEARIWQWINTMSHVN